MDLHVPTLLLALLLGFLILTAELAVCLRLLRTRRELLAWTIGCWLLLAGMALLAVPTALPTALSATLGNGLVAAGIALFAVALHQLLDRSRVPSWLFGALAGVVIASVVMLDWPFRLRAAVLSLVYAGMLVPSIEVIARRGWHAERSLRSVAATMGLAAFALLARAIHLLTDVDATVDGASDPSSVWLLLAFAGLLGAGFGFALAVLERVNRMLEDLATHDGLTGCLNRSTTDAMLAHELTRRRRLGVPVAFVLLDIDHFKRVNDRHGHSVGDAVLRRFAQTVRRRLRTSDIMGRTGGEEFALILPATDLPGARGLVDDIRMAVQADRTDGHGGRSVKVTVSSGIAVAGLDDEVTPEQLFARADEALYVAKRGGRNRVEHYSPRAPAELDAVAAPLTVQ